MGKKKKKKQRQKQKKQWLNMPSFGNKKDKKEKKQQNQMNHSYNSNYVDMYYCAKCENFLAHPVHENKNWNSCPNCKEEKDFSFAKRTYLKR